MLKSFVIFVLLAAVIIGAGCHPSTPPLTNNPTPIATPIPTSTPVELDPSLFIPLLRQVSEPFDQFYGNEIEPLHAEIHWFYDPNQSLTDANTAPCPDFKCANIYLSRIPNADEGNASLDKDAFIVAHELASLVIGPMLQNNEVLHCDNGQLGDRFVDMLRTPLRDHRLAKYGFDLENNFQSDLDGFTSFCDNPTDPLVVNIGAFIYAKLALYWQYVLGHDDIPTELDSYCQRCWPICGQEGLDILAMINGVGALENITPDKAHTLYQQIIDEYSVSCWLVKTK
jgi:hypothetical protein